MRRVKEKLDELKALEEEPVREAPLGYTLEDERRDKARAKALKKDSKGTGWQSNLIGWKALLSGFAAIGTIAIVWGLTRLPSTSQRTPLRDDTGLLVHPSNDDIRAPVGQSQAVDPQAQRRRDGDTIPITVAQAGTGSDDRWRPGLEWFNLGVKLLWLHQEGEIIRAKWISGRVQVTNESGLFLKRGFVTVQVFRSGHWWLSESMIEFTDLAPGATRECELSLRATWGELRIEDIDSWAVKLFNTGTLHTKDEWGYQHWVGLVARPLGRDSSN